MATQSDIHGIGATLLAVPSGATVALLITPTARGVVHTIKKFSGGSCEIIGCPSGSTLTGAQLVTAQGGGYLLGTAEVVVINGPAQYYLMATGATAVVYQWIGLSAGY